MVDKRVRCQPLRGLSFSLSSCVLLFVLYSAHSPFEYAAIFDLTLFCSSCRYPVLLDINNTSRTSPHVMFNSNYSNILYIKFFLRNIRPEFLSCVVSSLIISWLNMQYSKSAEYVYDSPPVTEIKNFVIPYTVFISEGHLTIVTCTMKFLFLPFVALGHIVVLL